jgi:hypothetical protein
VVDKLLAEVTELEFCEHELDGFAMWIVTRPDRLLCKFCYQALRCWQRTSWARPCGQPAGDPVQDAIVVVKVMNWLGAHFYLCTGLADPREAAARGRRLPRGD